MTNAADLLAATAAGLDRRGIRRILTMAWRDLDDPDAGGSEVHADEILTRWAAAGLAVVHRTSTAGAPRRLRRHGYGIIQAGGRIGVTARTPLAGIRNRRSFDAVIDIWNGIPWWSPVWFRGPSVTWLHHVHGKMWQDSFSPVMAGIGRTIERRLAPAVYRRRPIVTLSESSRREIVAIGLPAAHVSVIAPGVDPRFTPDLSRRRSTPHVVALGRLAPVKRYLALADSIKAGRQLVPNLTLDIVGEGPDRPLLERWIADNAAASWLRLPGRLSDDEVVRAYQEAWLVVGASMAEGWGMSLTEAAACATPAVATDIAGHRDAVDDNVSGILVADPACIGPVVAGLVSDRRRYQALVDGARARATRLSWDQAAQAHLEVLSAEVDRHAAVT